VSLLGLGSGGLNPFGQKTGVPEAEIHKLVRAALDLGINFFDTAPPPVYLESESILGRALAGVPRENYILSTKVTLAQPDSDALLTPDEIRKTIDDSLRRLQTDYVDLILIGGNPATYERIREELIPTFRKVQAEGKFRFLGSTEKSAVDGSHEWLQLGLRDDLYDVVMAAYNLVNQSAERTVFPCCRKNDVGVLNIFTVRTAFSRPERLREVLNDLAARGVVPTEAAEGGTPLEWLTRETEHSLVNAAYRFAAANPQVSTIMTGTLNMQHLQKNVRIINQPPLNNAQVARLRELFGNVAEPVGN
jgi:aryl-alcohol dehydrogenase-like predicted oxidoreductase